MRAFLLGGNNMTQEENNSNEEQVVIKLEAPTIGYRPGEFKITWNFLSPQYARMGFMSNIPEHPFTKYLRKVMRGNYVRIMHLTTEKPSNADDVAEIDIIGMFETAPTGENQSEFESMRMRWVQLYLDVISYAADKSRAEFIPKMQYRPHLEGPLMGYIRPIVSMKDSKDKDLLMEEMDKLRAVKWHTITNSDGRITDYIYEIQGETTIQRIQSLIIGAWSMMVVIVLRNDGEMVMQFIELTESLLSENLTERERHFIEEMINLLMDLTFPSLDFLNLLEEGVEHIPDVCMLIQSPLLFPNNNVRVRHMLYANEKTKDFDLRSFIPDLKPLVDNEAVWRFKENGIENIKKVNLSIEV